MKNLFAIRNVFSLLVCILISNQLVKAQSPSFQWAKAMGGSSSDLGESVVVDVSGNVYTTGSFATTTDFDPGVGTFTMTSAGGVDIFISKFDASGNFVWAKQLGGTGADKGFSITTDASGNVYTTGEFSGTGDFDPGVGISNLVSAGQTDVFISKLDPSGNFVWAKKIGGSGLDFGKSIKVDGSNVYTTGGFNVIVDFDPSVGTFTMSSAGSSDIFISKLDVAGNFVWAKQLGGSSGDEGLGLCIDASGVHITGTFQGTGDFDPNIGISNLSSSGVTDIFITKIDLAGNFSWAKKIGSALTDEGHSITVDASGNVYTTGRFSGVADFDPGAGTVNLTPANYDIFISKLDASGNFVWARNMGGATADIGTEIALDASGNVYTTGSFLNVADFDPGAGVFNLTSSGAQDVFISKLDASGNFVFAVKLSSASDELGQSIFIDPSNNIYSTGYFQTTTDFDPSAATFALTSVGGGADVFVHKMSQCSLPTAPTNTTPVSNQNICSGNSTTLSVTGLGTINWYATATGTTVLTTGGSLATPTLSLGTYTYYAESTTCGAGPRTPITITVAATPTVTISTSTTSICSGSAVTLTAGGATTYTWNTSATTAIISVTPNITTTYTVTGTNGNCTNTKTITINVTTTPTVNISASSSTLCSGNTTTITATGASTYSWNTSATTNSISVSPTISTNYTVTGTSSGCTNTKTISINVTTTPTVNTSASSNTICTGNTTTITASGATTYSWNTSATTNTISVSPTVTTTYTVTGNNGGCSNTKTITITNNTPNLNVSATSTAICSGGSSTLTASGAATYSWNTSATTSVIAVSPIGNTTYTVTGTIGSCTSTSVISVNVGSAITINAIPSMSVSCSGAPVIITASGASTYTWSTGPNTTTISVSPTSSTNYTVSGTSGTCSGSTVITIGVSTNPTVNSVTSQSLICTLPVQQSATLTASGATTYSWNTGATTAAITVSPGITTTYTVTGYNAQGCMNTSVITQSVSACAGVNELVYGSSVVIYPNPSNGEFTIKGIEGKVEIINSIGQTVYTSELNTDELKVTGLAVGIYYLKTEKSIIGKKIIINN